MALRVTKISVRNYKRIENVDIEIDVFRRREDEREYEVNKLLLFGPNGGGKSSLIAALSVLLSYLDESGKYYTVFGDLFGLPQSLIRQGAKRAEIEAAINDKRYKAVIDREGGAEVYEIGEAGEIKLSRGVLMFSIAILQPCSLYSSVRQPYQGEEIGKLELCPPGIRVRDPDLAEWIKRHKFLLGVEDFYGDRVKIVNYWVEVDKLAFGQIRTLGLLHATYGPPDVVIIEPFETGLHYDLAVRILDFLTELPSFIILETHVALLVKAALRRGWTVYYVSEGEFTRVRKPEELRGIARAEANAYVYA
ncbi:hypothetical protein [Pyrobaculum aerophilum]|uniref:hypothetical protein n=1 Tax=Pyrobaculum aerophilum TaxID=13773 RepID=UPI0023F44DA8|nr:hypothetical protein [Pyrobaculum aerophilum]MCX8137559.1 hypothetical protein [Pyrobaculum aerophilum]